MRIRPVIGALVTATAAAAAPALAASAPAASATSVPAACVVVHLPSGGTVQTGYAPNGPDGCTALP